MVVTLELSEAPAPSVAVVPLVLAALAVPPAIMGTSPVLPLAVTAATAATDSMVYSVLAATVATVEPAAS
jgi:hypothetical protein